MLFKQEHDTTIYISFNLQIYTSHDLLSTAHHVGMSPAHFSTIFSQKLGKTFINYLTSLRMEKAKELLTSTNRKLSEIALDVGYNEPNYFSHVFRKMEGITPKEYRNRATGQ